MSAAIYRVIGFCDVPGKPVGHAGNTYFREADCFECDVLPPRDLLRQYASDRGYFPSRHRGAHPGLCDPVYRYLPGAPDEHRIRPRGDGT